MSTLACATITVHGKVQGVYFRAFTSRIAKSLALKGYARNLPRSNTVEIYAEGEKAKLENLIQQLEVGPPEALVESVEVIWSEFTGMYVNFDVRY